MGYEAPRDIMQDIVSSQEMLQGSPLYPPNMVEMTRASLKREPARLSLGRVWPRLREREREALRRAVTFLWIQAHPPLMALFLASIVASLGMHGTYVAFSLLSLSLSTDADVAASGGVGFFHSGLSGSLALEVCAVRTYPARAFSRVMRKSCHL